MLSCTRKNAEEISQEFPRRIVALSPSAAEILFAVGAGSQVAAVSEFTDYPPEAAELPVAGGFDGRTISTEKILSFKPDFVYLTDGMHNFLIPQLEQYEIPCYLSRGNSIQSVLDEISEIGTLTGHPGQAEELVQKMRGQLATVSKAAEPVSVYWEVWNSPYMSIETGAEGPTLLIFKDSYAHAMIPFLTAHFSRITVLDMRYIHDGISNHVNVDDYDSVLFVYNAISFSQDRDIRGISID